MSRINKLESRLHSPLSAVSLSKTLKLTSVLLLALLAACSDESAVEQAGGHAVSESSSSLETSPLDNLQGNAEQNSGAVRQPELFAETRADSGKQGDAQLTDEGNGELADSEEDQYADYEPSTTVTFSAEETSGVIRWEAPEGLSYSNAKVIISGKGGDMTTRNFSPGEPIELYGELPDGVYGWETVISPEVDEFVREEMRSVRASGDLQAENELKARLRAEGSLPTKEQARENRQSGNFVVQDGIVRPSLVDVPNSDQDNGG